MSNTILQMKDVHSYYGESQILFGLNLKVGRQLGLHPRP